MRVICIYDGKWWLKILFIKFFFSGPKYMEECYVTGVKGDYYFLEGYPSDLRYCAAFFIPLSEIDGVAILQERTTEKVET